ncbi:MAG TPA: hypothetical protein VH561_20665 [Micromonosporaceae bacterium]
MLAPTHRPLPYRPGHDAFDQSTGAALVIASACSSLWSLDIGGHPGTPGIEHPTYLHEFVETRVPATAGPAGDGGR